MTASESPAHFAATTVEETINRIGAMNLCTGGTLKFQERMADASRPERGVSTGHRARPACPDVGDTYIAASPETAARKKATR